MLATGMDEAAVARAARVTRPAVIQWLGKGGENSKEIKSLGVKPACYLEEETGFKALWLATGEGETPNKPTATHRGGFFFSFRRLLQETLS